MMTPYCPNVIPNARYSKKEAAELLGVHPNTISNYVKRSGLRATYSKANGWPKFTGAEILRFWKESL